MGSMDRTRTEASTGRASEDRSSDVREMLVADVMGRPPVSVGLRTSLGRALEVLTTFGVRHLVVTDETGRCAGLLTDRAVVAHWAGRPAEFDRAYVSATYAPDVACVRKDTKLADAAQAMRLAGLDAVIVVGDQHEPLGIVTATDLIGAVATSSGVPGVVPDPPAEPDD